MTSLDEVTLVANEIAEPSLQCYDYLPLPNPSIYGPLDDNRYLRPRPGSLQGPKDGLCINERH
jgi:hypothetical protein